MKINCSSKETFYSLCLRDNQKIYNFKNILKNTIDENKSRSFSINKHNFFASSSSGVVYEFDNRKSDC